MSFQRLDQILKAEIRHRELAPSSCIKENSSSGKWVETKKSRFLKIRAGRKSKSSDAAFVITVKSYFIDNQQREL